MQEDRPLNKEIMAKVQQDFKQIFEKHAQAFTRFSHEIFPSQEFQNSLAHLTEKIDPTRQSEAFFKEYNNLKIQFCPELAELHKGIEAISKKYSSVA